MIKFTRKLHCFRVRSRAHSGTFTEINTVILKSFGLDKHGKVPVSPTASASASLAPPGSPRVRRHVP